MTPSHSDLTIRHADVGDATLLADLGATTFAETFAADNTPDDINAYLREAFTPTRLRQELADPNATFLIVEIAGATAGYAKLQIGPPEVCVTGSAPIELVRLYVRADSIGQGVGSALMQACLQDAIVRGYQTLWLGVWEHNRRARRFYQKHGFQEVGSHVFQLGSDAQTDLILQKPVQS